MFAVVETGGKQYRVEPGTIFQVEKLPVAKGDTVELDRVLMLTDEAGQTKIGTPYVAGAKVIAKVLVQDKARKILVFKYKAKKNYRRRMGHRQPFTRLVVEKIEA